MTKRSFPDLIISKEEKRAIVESLVSDAGAIVGQLQKDPNRKMHYQFYHEEPDVSIKFLSDLSGSRMQIIAAYTYGFDYYTDDKQ